MSRLCHILNVGPNPSIRRALALLQGEGLASIQHADASSVAFEILGQLRDSDLPDLVVIPVQLPILTCFDFIHAMHANVRCRAIPLLVWGHNIPPQMIEQIYEAGAACVLPIQSWTAIVDIIRNFCRSRWPSDAEVDPVDPVEAFVSPILPYAERAKRNAKLGALFLWTGCLSAVLWVFYFLGLGSSFTSTDFTPLFVYGALAYVGILLITHPAPKVRVASSVPG